MKTLSYSIEIARPLALVYGLAKQVECQPELIPDYLSCRVLDRENGRLLLERSAKVRGRIVTWLSWASFRENEAVAFTHQGGRLDGMQVLWTFAPMGEALTRLTITQKFHIPHPIPGVGYILEEWIFGPKLRDLAMRVLRSFETACLASRTAGVNANAQVSIR